MGEAGLGVKGPVETNSPADSAHTRGMLARLWPWLAAALSGALLAMSLPPWNAHWLAWIGLAPLIAAVWFSPATKRNQRRQALLGYVAGMVFFTTTFYWLSALGTLFGEVWLKSLPLLLSLIFGFYFAFWAWFIGRIRTGASEEFISSAANLRTAFWGAAAWVTHEWVRGWLFSGFGWNGLGVALHNDLAMIQISELTGVLGLSFLLAFCNLMAVIIARRLVAELGPVFLKRVRWEFSLTAAMVVGVFAYGVRALFAFQQEPGETELIRIAAVQPNIPQTEKFSTESEDAVLSELDRLTGLAAATQPNLILWPEAATPRGMYADKLNYDFVMSQLARGEFGLLIGTVDESADAAQSFNTATLLTSAGNERQIHRKMHLVPFGEYLPFRQSFPLFAMVAGKLVPADFTAGSEYTVMSLPKPALKFSALICFEDTLGELTRHFVANGAQLLVNITNDGWFLQTAGAEQHLANAIFRTVENRRPMVRCANTGVSCSIDRTGRLDRWIAPFERGFAARELKVPKTTTLSFYCRHGDWLAWVCLGLTACPLLTRWIFKRR